MRSQVMRRARAVLCSCAVLGCMIGVGPRAASGQDLSPPGPLKPASQVLGHPKIHSLFTSSDWDTEDPAALSEKRIGGFKHALIDSKGVAGGEGGPTATPTPTVGPEPCVGDCNGDGVVTLHELMRMVNIALGNTPCCLDCAAADAAKTGMVSVVQIITAVKNAMHGCPATPAPTVSPTPLPTDAMAVIGGCLKPGPRDLVPCDVGTRITLSRCEDYSDCSAHPEARTLLGEGRTDARGRFWVLVRASRAQAALLIPEAPEIDSATVYRSYLVPAAARTAPQNAQRVAAPQGIPAVEVTIDPSSEAGVRLVDQKGLQNLSYEGIAAVQQAVRAATETSTFAGLSPSDAADRATDVASQDPTLQETIQQSEFAGTICFANKQPTQFDVTLDTSLKSTSAMEVNLAVLYQGPANPIDPEVSFTQGCSPEFIWSGSFTYLNQPGMVRYTFQLTAPRQIPTSPVPLFNCEIDPFYYPSTAPFVVSCLSGNIDGRPLRCCTSPFKTKAVVFVPPGEGCCQFSNSCLNVSEGNCSTFSSQVFGDGFRCDHGVGCNEQ